MPNSNNPYSIPDQGPQPKKGVRLDPALTKMAEEDPVGYVAHMQSTGRASELEPSDHIRAATTNFARKLFGGGGQ